MRTLLHSLVSDTLLYLNATPTPRPVIQELPPPPPPPGPVEILPPSPSIAETLSKIAPGLRLVANEATVLLLAFGQEAETLEFLKSLAKAIDTHLGDVKILPADRFEKEERWEQLFEANPCRLIVSSEGWQEAPHLRRALGKIPFLALQRASCYKQLEEKARVWKTLCQILKP